jgi:serine/threonine-protein kinase
VKTSFPGSAAGPYQHKPLQQFGPYRIEALLGEGAAAAVYRARRADGQVVALKVLHQAAAQDSKTRQAFDREARILMRLNHPGVIRALDSGQIEGHFYIALTLVTGETLDEFLQVHKKLGETAAIDIAIQIANALGYLHNLRIVHRDLKPGNVLLEQRRRTVLFDFGAAIDLRIDQIVPGAIYGTPAFLAPEQARGDAVIDGRVDLYALGVTLYRMVAGRKPFYGSRSELLHAQIYTLPPPPSNFAYISPALEGVILKALAKQPEARFATAEEMADALNQARHAMQDEPPPKQELPKRLLGWLRHTIAPPE